MVAKRVWVKSSRAGGGVQRPRRSSSWAIVVMSITLAYRRRAMLYRKACSNASACGRRRCRLGVCGAGKEEQRL